MSVLYGGCGVHNYMLRLVMLTSIHILKMQFAAVALVVSLLYTRGRRAQPVHDSANKAKAES